MPSGSIGISVASTLVTRRQQLHQSRLVEHLQPLDPSYTAFTSQLNHAVGVVAGAPQSIARISRLASEQVMLLSYLDTFEFFWVAFLLLLLLLLPLLLFVRPGAASGGAAA